MNQHKKHRPKMEPKVLQDAVGFQTDVYTVTGNGKVGRDNLGHDIPELLPVPNEITTVSSQQKLTADMSPLPSGSRLRRRIIAGIDITIVILVLLCLLVVELGILPHVQTGFYCDDRTITFKYTGELISTSSILLSTIVPLFLMWLNEALFYQPSSVKTTRCRKSFADAFHWFKKYYIGMILQLLVLETIKILIGEPRPHFLDSCRPDLAVNCSGSDYITQYKCTNTEDTNAFIKDSSKSFPSGHGCISFYEAIFMIWYLQRKVPAVRSQLILPALQTILLCWACFCSASRIIDHRHHWWDVVAGAAMGIASAILICLVLCKNFKRRSQEPIIQNGNGDRHTSVRRLLSRSSYKDEVTMNNVAVS